MILFFAVLTVFWHRHFRGSLATTFADAIAGNMSAATSQNAAISLSVVHAAVAA